MRCAAIPVRDCRVFLLCGRQDPWSVGRNGGTMADSQKKPSGAKKKKKPSGAKTKTTTGSTAAKNSRVKAVRGKTPCVDGAGQLRVAADQWLGWNSDTIANALADKAANGDLASAKALLTLADGKKASAEEVKKMCGPSLAAQWAAEPHWQGGEGGSKEQGTGNSERRSNKR
jgi:hypothetical protein